MTPEAYKGDIKYPNVGVLIVDQENKPKEQLEVISIGDVVISDSLEYHISDITLELAQAIFSAYGASLGISLIACVELANEVKARPERYNHGILDYSNLSRRDLISVISSLATGFLIGGIAPHVILPDKGNEAAETAVRYRESISRMLGDEYQAEGINHIVKGALYPIETFDSLLSKHNGIVKDLRNESIKCFEPYSLIVRPDLTVKAMPITFGKQIEYVYFFEPRYFDTPRATLLPSVIFSDPNSDRTVVNAHIAEFTKLYNPESVVSFGRTSMPNIYKPDNLGDLNKSRSHSVSSNLVLKYENSVLFLNQPWTGYLGVGYADKVFASILDNENTHKLNPLEYLALSHWKMEWSPYYVNYWSQDEVLRSFMSEHGRRIISHRFNNTGNGYLGDGLHNTRSLVIGENGNVNIANVAEIEKAFTNDLIVESLEPNGTLPKYSISTPGVVLYSQDLSFSTNNEASARKSPTLSGFILSEDGKYILPAIASHNLRMLNKQIIEICSSYISTLQGNVRKSLEEGYYFVFTDIHSGAEIRMI